MRRKMLRLHHDIALQQTPLTYMGRLLLFFLCAFAARNAAAQSKPSPALKRELDSIFVVDQHYREMIMQSFTPAGAQVVAAKLNMTTQQASAFFGTPHATKRLFRPAPYRPDNAAVWLSG